MPIYDRACDCGWTARDVWEAVNATEDCPQCGLPTRRVWTSRATSVNRDECDVWQENGFHVPTRFTSKTELDRALSQQGKEIRVRHQPLPGTDKSPHTVDWSRGSIDPQTLANAAALVARAGQAKGTEAEPDDLPVTFTVTELGA